MIHRKEFENSRDIIKYLLLFTRHYTRGQQVQLHILDARNIAPIRLINFFRIDFIIAFGLRRELLGFPLLTKLVTSRGLAW